MPEVQIPHTYLTLRPPTGMRFLQAIENGRECVKLEYQKGREKEAAIWFEDWVLNHMILPEPIIMKTVQVPVNPQDALLTKEE